MIHMQINDIKIGVILIIEKYFDDYEKAHHPISTITNKQINKQCMTEIVKYEIQQLNGWCFVEKFKNFKNFKEK